ncbi:MAG: kelch repeat-containing protein [bacterium]
MKITRIFILVAVLALLIDLSEVQAQSASWKTLSKVGFTPNRDGLSSSYFNGKIYCIGGYDGRFPINLLQVYDIASNSWSTPQTQGSFLPRASHTATVLNGKIYVIGGEIDNTTFADSVSVFDPQTNTWTTDDLREGSLLFTDRGLATSCSIGDSIYVVGGNDRNIGWLTTVEIYDTKRHSWTTPPYTVDSMHQVYSPHAVAMGNKIYVVGLPPDSTCHCDLQIYDVATNKWSSPQKNSLAYPRLDNSLGEINGKIYAIGGGDWYHGGRNLSNTEVFDTATNRWSLLNTSGTFGSRFEPSATSGGNKVYVIGGFNLDTTYLVQVLSIGGAGVEESGKLHYNSRVYPNPATTRLTIASVERGTPFKMIDVFGRSVITGMTLDNAPLTVDISSIPRGIYYVLVERADWKGVYAIAGKVAVVEP